MSKLYEVELIDRGVNVVAEVEARDKKDAEEQARRWFAPNAIKILSVKDTLFRSVAS